MSKATNLDKQILLRDIKKAIETAVYCGMEPEEIEATILTLVSRESIQKIYEPIHEFIGDDPFVS